jgi:hypothetical protein
METTGGIPLAVHLKLKFFLETANGGAGWAFFVDKGWKEWLDKWKLKTDTELVEKTVTLWGPVSVTSPQSQICAGPGPS